MTVTELENIRFYDYHPKPADIHADIIHGLNRTQKQLPPKYFYDHRGSQLFDAICTLPEYYQTRTESAILQQNAIAISECIGKDVLLIEPGSGSSHKVRLLLDELRPEVYLPMDISRQHLLQAAQSVSDDYPWLEVCAGCVDFTEQMPIPNYLAECDNKVVFFPGSSIGNFEPRDAVGFLCDVAALVRPGGGLLIG
ncbi:MAG: L-histidine N(alpha)-methyltransferase, partial [Gammaproteobacteria bacterium]|nr:L-histidine N(alpha)-methyltransferase [Gammaproteobacteria bacterium]